MLYDSDLSIWLFLNTGLVNIMHRLDAGMQAGKGSFSTILHNNSSYNFSNQPVACIRNEQLFGSEVHLEC